MIMYEYIEEGGSKSYEITLMNIDNWDFKRKRNVDGKKNGNSISFTIIEISNSLLPVFDSLL